MVSRFEGAYAERVDPKSFQEPAACHRAPRPKPIRLTGIPKSPCSAMASSPNSSTRRPPGRADTGASRAIAPEVLTQAIALREEQPARTTQTIVDILQRDPQLTLGQPINVHTLTTQLRQHGKTRRLLNQSAKA